MAQAIWGRYNLLYQEELSYPCAECGGTGNTGMRWRCNECNYAWPISQGMNPCPYCNKWVVGGERPKIPIIHQPCKGQGKIVTRPSGYTVGSFIENVIAEADTYPKYGQAGNYWYIYIGPATDFKANISGVYKDIQPFANINGVWKTGGDVKANINGIWK